VFAVIAEPFLLPSTGPAELVWKLAVLHKVHSKMNDLWEAEMEWSDLRIFLAVAREGTLGAAARKLGQSQPTMGRRLRALERSIGQTLFQRTGDGFVLT
jgi:hypothetical protein